MPYIKHLAMYPIKSCGRIELDSAILTRHGLMKNQYSDHEYMIVRDNPDHEGVYSFITQRQKRNESDKQPQTLSVMSLIKPEFHGDLLKLTWDGKDPITMPYWKDDGTILKVKVWDDVCLAVDQGNDLSYWLSDYLGLNVRLVKAAGPFKRKARQNYMQNDNAIYFHDAYPIHWFSAASIEELNEKAGYEFPWTSFRPQIVVDGMPAREEHDIYSGYISGLAFRNAKPCDRCPMPKVDQETGELRKNDPNTTLAAYKRWKNKDGELKVIFGENMLPSIMGKIEIGDELIVTEKRNPALGYF